MIKIANKITTAVLFSVLAMTGCAVATAADEATVAPDKAPADVITNMDKMQQQMRAIHVSKDPKTRAKLIDEHLETIQSTLLIMQHEKGCMMMMHRIAMQNADK